MTETSITKNTNDIMLSRFTLVAKSRGHWIFPGGMETTNRKQAVLLATRINAQMERMMGGAPK